MSTKEELVAEIERLNQELKDKDDQLAQRDAVDQAGSQGWIISTPNQAYSGRTAGVLFENGHAFIPASHPKARKLLNTLLNDFGYSASETSSGQEVAQPKPGPKQTLSEKLMRPQVMT